MHALRVARTHHSLRALLRSASTAAPHPSVTARTHPVPIPFSNIEAQWERISKDDKVNIAFQLEELQKKDWKDLSLEQKRAVYYVAYGPHGPRTPKNPPGTTMKVLAGVAGLLGVSTLLVLLVRSQAPPPPRTLTKEWQEASNERARELKINPISGISSEGYKGKGFVTADK